MKINRFHHANKTNNHKTSVSLDLVLKAKPFRIREGPIERQSKTFRNATSRLPDFQIQHSKPLGHAYSSFRPHVYKS